ncbi:MULTISPECIES: hypothetical protein [unclassified Saccharothrix]|uniref:hypothetical protein n=1 Tax=unclassified Saccharothrix TaxID=2593673 RepID=UPI00307CEB56
MGYTPAMLWVHNDGTNTMRWSRTGVVTDRPDTWSDQEISWGAERRAVTAPALTRHIDGLYAAWVGPDHYIHTSRLGDSPIADQHGTVWSAPRNSGFQTAQNPTLASYDNHLFLAWKDKTEGTIHWARGTGAGWEAQVATPWRTSHGPALGAALFGGMVMAWKGQSPDNQLHWIQYNPRIGWFDGQPRRYEGWSAAAPALVGTWGHIYMAWRGQTTADHDDTRLWWSRYDAGWAPQRPLDGWSVTGPELAADGDTVYLVYTEQTPSDGHGQLYWTRTTTSGDWVGHQALGNRKTYFTPAIA